MWDESWSDNIMIWGEFNVNLCSSLSPAACESLKNTAVSPYFWEHDFSLFLLPVQSLLGGTVKHLEAENTDKHSICPRLSSDKVHFEKCLLWWLPTISAHSGHSETDSKEEVFQSDRLFFISAGHWPAGRWTELWVWSGKPETSHWLGAWEDAVWKVLDGHKQVITI